MYTLKSNVLFRTSKKLSSKCILLIIIFRIIVFNKIASITKLFFNKMLISLTLSKFDIDSHTNQNIRGKTFLFLPVLIFFITMGATRNIFKLGALEAKKTAFFLCDVQEVFRPHIKFFSEVVKVSNKMVSFNSVVT